MRALRRLVILIAACVFATPVVAYGQTLTAMWDPNPPGDQVTSYEVCIGTASLSCNFQQVSVPATATSHTFTPVAGVLYYVAVRAISASGVGQYSPEVSVSIPSLTQPIDQTSSVNIPISPLTLLANDPDGGTLQFSHTGLPVGLSLHQTSGVISGSPTSASTYNVTVYVTDGLTTTSRMFNWIVQPAGAGDTTAPSLSITSHTSGQSVTTSSITLAGTASDSGAGGSGVNVTVNGSAPTGGTANGSNTANWSRTLSLSMGANNILVEARDGAGNVRSSQLTINRIISPVTGVTLSGNLSSPRLTGTAITFTASGTGGVAPRQYKFLVQLGGGAAQVVQNWSSTATYTWTPGTAGSYTVSVWARSAGVTADVADASAQMPYVITAPLSISSLTSNLTSPQVTGTAITFSVAATGGTAPYQFKWWLFDGVNWILLRDWNTATTYPWTPATANANYRIGVWARSAGVTADTNSVNLSIAYVINTATQPPPPPPPPPPSALTLTGLTSNLASPQAPGATITFTAGATGGTAPYQFKWWLFDGVNWTMVRDWNTSATYAWTPAVANANYRIGVWARNAGVTADVNSVNLSIAYVVTGGAPPPPPPPPPTSLTLTGLTGNVASPQPAGTSITFTAAASGGTTPYQFKWWLFDGVNWTMARDWGAATYTWTPTAANANYRVGVWARNAGVTADVSNVNLSIPYVITGGTTPPPPPPPSVLTLTGVTGSVASPQAAGTTITFTAAAGGGTAPYQFKWWLFDGINWTMVRDWGAATYTWTPTLANGNYRIGVWARNAGVTADTNSVNLSIGYVITAGTPPPPGTPLTITSLAGNLTSPRATGTSITFTAAAGGGTAPYQFKWWLFDGVNWTMVRDWGNSTYVWTPMVASANYRIGVWARSATTTADVGEANVSVPYVITGAPAPVGSLLITTISSSVPGPVRAGIPVTMTAAATGGTAPYQFKWWLFDGVNWTMVQDWGPGVYAFTPTVVNPNFRVGVWARSAGSTSDVGTTNLSIPFPIIP